MALSMATLARLIAALTLLVAAFVVAPVADAAACAPEIPSAHQAADHPPSGGDHTSGGDHGICSHGHCHHSGTERPTLAEVATLSPISPVVHGLARGDVVVSHPSDGLKRPPRA